MCIYMGDKGELTYKNQEHVFPAGLGGKQMLAKGVVSDQANNLFSSLELKLMRHSILTIDRMMYGPGKRGSHNPSKASKSAINVGLQDDGVPILCYTAAGKPYNVPQFHQHMDEVTISVPNEHADAQAQFLQFLESLKKFKEKYVFLESEHISEEDLIIGFCEGTYYVATNKDKPDIKDIRGAIERLLENFQMGELKEGEHHVKQKLKLGESSEIARVYAKVAINTLAFCRGSEYASHINFEEIRKWILTGEASQEFFYLPQIQVEPEDYIMNLVPDKAHWCILVSNKGNLDAIVCFYNRYIRRFTLGAIPEGKKFLVDGFICDWQNEKEYTIDKFVSMIARSLQSNREE